jgi:hypothetical protein
MRISAWTSRARIAPTRFVDSAEASENNPDRLIGSHLDMFFGSALRLFAILFCGGFWFGLYHLFG